MSGNGKVLERYTTRLVDEGGGNGHAVDSEAPDDFGCFGWLRGIKDRAISLELRKKTGNIVAIGYGWITKYEFDPSEGITLHANGEKILIQGRNLNNEIRPMVRLFEGLTRNRIPWIKECDESLDGESAAGLTFVETIKW
jgi:hypothetical protein